jgi:O-antigen ligase
MKGFIIGITIFFAVLGGLVTGLFGVASLFLIPPILFALLIIYDYRYGVIFVALALAFSSSPLLPHTAGFNPLTIALTSAVLVFGIQRVFSPQNIVRPPKVLIICLVIPLFVGIALAIPHLGEGARNFNTADLRETYSTYNYIKIFLIHPLAIVVLSMMVANAIRDSRRPENFVLMFAIASLIPVAAIVALIAFLGLDLGALQANRNYLSGLGLHATSFGKLLAFPLGPLLYVSFATRGFRRIFFTLATIAVAIGILLTFTRAAYVAMAIVFMIFLVQRRNIGTLIAMVTLLPVLLLVMPSAFVERITLGVDSKEVASAQSGALNDKLTAGRVGGIQLMLPEVKRSPIIGRGLGATAWSSPVSHGLYDFTHPHNLYLEITLDLGIVGLGLTLYWFRRVYDGFNRLSRHPELSKEMHAFFKGSAISFIGILASMLAGGHWYPHPEQALMWIALGVAFAYWPWVEAQRAIERSAKVEKMSKAAQKLDVPAAIQGF